MIYRLIAADASGNHLLEAFSKERPDEATADALAATAQRFGLGIATEFGLQQLRVCRKCGCTELRACPGGCYWVAEDLCSRCDGKKR